MRVLVGERRTVDGKVDGGEGGGEGREAEGEEEEGEEGGEFEGVVDGASQEQREYYAENDEETVLRAADTRGWFGQRSRLRGSGGGSGGGGREGVFHRGERSEENHSQEALLSRGRVGARDRVGRNSRPTDMPRSSAWLGRVARSDGGTIPARCEPYR